jgi:hypothetical protein
MWNSSRPATKLLGLCLGFLAAVALSAGALAASSRLHPSAAAGRYSILRAEDRDTGCMLTLDDKTRGRGGYKAQLAPACRDNGLVVFDPVAWSIDRAGRLALTARKGHKAHFDLQDGIWRRDPKEGKELSLKPL